MSVRGPEDSTDLIQSQLPISSVGETALHRNLYTTTCHVATTVLLAASAVATFAQTGSVPEGFTRIFNGKDISGWHWSRTNHHGTVAQADIEDGALVLRPRPFGQGGVLLTDQDYRDFEFYVELKPDSNYNSGIFLRSSEGGAAYQIEIQRPGNTGNFLGERISVQAPQYIGERRDINEVWKDGEWNSLRVRMVGGAPRVTLWINDIQMYELQCARNDLPAGMTAGKIGLQLHFTSTHDEVGGTGGGGASWLVQRFRNMAIKELR
jgi:hypothetical protein